MIIYFSATGNNKYIAQRLAAANEPLISISDWARRGAPPILTVEEGEDIGLVTPTYFWGLPAIVEDFLRDTRIETKGRPYVYHVLTYGSSTGGAHQRMAKLLAAQGLELQGRFAIAMVDTWTPMFDLSDAAKNLQITQEAEPLIDKVISQVRAKTIGDFNPAKAPAFMATMLRREYNTKRATKHFGVADTCVGCGLCAKQCPLGVIELREGKPVWVKDKCNLCLGCLHRCPQFAIHYANKTQNHGQFINPNVEL